MAGLPVGLDLNNALAALPPEVDRHFTATLLTAAELPYLAAWHQSHKAENPDER